MDSEKKIYLRIIIIGTADGLYLIIDKNAKKY